MKIRTLGEGGNTSTGPGGQYFLPNFHDCKLKEMEKNVTAWVPGGVDVQIVAIFVTYFW